MALEHLRCLPPRSASVVAQWRALPQRGDAAAAAAMGKGGRGPDLRGHRRAQGRPCNARRGLMRRTALFERLVRLLHRIYGATRHGQVDDIVASAPTGSVQSLQGKRLCAVASYKRDGTAVVTPVWFGLN